MKKEIEDSKLVSLYISGDRKSFTILYERYERPLFSYVYKMLNNREDAEEIFQKTWMKVIEKLKYYNEKGKFSSWLFSIAHNCTIDMLRKTSRKRENLSVTEIDFKISASDKNPEEILVMDEQKKRLKKVIEYLPEEQRETVMMRVYGDLSFKEIAKIQKVSLNTVLGRMHYAVKKIKKELGVVSNEM